ncbi:thymidylate synthase [Pseudovibrio axinellae]|nr:thymidylate synthase [Pseudovibrio axinellae]
MNSVYSRLLNGKGVERVESSTKGANTEVFGALLELRNPRARLSRSQSRGKVFSALGELTWYLSGSQRIDFIKYYLPKYHEFSNDKITANGAYGPRLFGLDGAARKSKESQWDRVIETLRTRPDSRNAIIQVFSNDDAFDENKDKPCTCTLHFAIRNKKLQLHTHMRSNDAVKGLPHDIFSFTMLQEIAARELDVDLGRYKHSVASLHIYDDKPESETESADLSRSAAQNFLKSGKFEHIPMPHMPAGDPWIGVQELLKAESHFRRGDFDYAVPNTLDAYWKDLASLLLAHSLFKRTINLESSRSEYISLLRRIASIARSMTSQVYRLYIQDRLAHRDVPIRDLFSR